jgi:2-polyprenyl-3-methyl-5-hydroxy-6-metoxy-1,4-benzoquinol methylase
MISHAPSPKSKPSKTLALIHYLCGLAQACTPMGQDPSTFQVDKTPRIDKTLFQEGHFLGRPADFDDLIVQRRLQLTEGLPNFTGKDLTLVDVGCGNGASAFFLADKFKYVLGIDVWEGHRSSFEAYKTHSGITNVDFLKLDLESESHPTQYDRLISFEVIEHLNDDRNVTSFFNLVKPGGQIAISVPNKWWIFETHGANLPLLPWNRVPFFSWLPTFIHERFANARIYTPARIRRVLERAGFEVISVQNITAPLDVLKPSGFKRWLQANIFRGNTTTIPFKATALFVHAVRR